MSACCPKTYTEEIFETGVVPFSKHPAVFMVSGHYAIEQYFNGLSRRQEMRGRFTLKDTPNELGKFLANNQALGIGGDDPVVSLKSPEDVPVLFISTFLFMLFVCVVVFISW